MSTTGAPATRAHPPDASGAVAAPPPAARPGRRRDSSRDAVILEQTLSVLAEAGYDGLTIDKVAARAGAARATVYRRWPTKADLVIAAVQRLASGDVDPTALPDTGDLRGDLVAMVLPISEPEADLRMKVLASVASLALREEPGLADAARTASTGPWSAALSAVLQRAVTRGQVPGGDIATLAEVVPAACLARAITGRPITREFSLALIDAVLLPAMHAGR